jgi:hypothetical protein
MPELIILLAYLMLNSRHNQALTTQPYLIAVTRTTTTPINGLKLTTGLPPTINRTTIV